MTNKQLIKKLRDNAELAWAAYGYFDLMTNENNGFFIKVKNAKNEDEEKPISIQDILDITYKDYEVYKKPSPLPTLKPEKSAHSKVICPLLKFKISLNAMNS